MTKLTVLMLLLCTHTFSQVKIQSGAAINLNGGVVLTLQDLDLDNEGTFNPAAGAGRVVFKGTASNFVRGVSGFDELEIAKTANNALVLQSDVDIRGGVWFTSGLINLNNHVLTLRGNSLLNGESENSRVTGAAGGYVQLSIQLNNPQDVNPGNMGAIISSTQNLGLTVIRRGHQSQTVEPGRSSVLRYYDITPANNTALNATLRVQYADAELNSNLEAGLQFRLSDNLTTFTKRASAGRNVTTNYAELQGINNFGRITLADDGVNLPVVFTLFTVECRYSEALLSWKTASEVNGGHFEIQRSINGVSWTSIGAVPATGNSTTEQQYAYADKDPQGKFYRIKEIDLDGHTQYSLVGTADCEGGNTWRVWPNPVQEQLFVTIRAERAGAATIQVYNGEGKLVKKLNSNLLRGSNQLSVDMTRLTRGHYHVEVVWDEGMRKGVTVLKK